MQAGGVKKLAEVKGLLIKATIGCKVGNEFIDIYQTYRNSVIGLVIVNFVIAYTVVLYSIFGWDNDGL